MTTKDYRYSCASAPFKHLVQILQTRYVYYRSFILSSLYQALGRDEIPSDGRKHDMLDLPRHPLLLPRSFLLFLVRKRSFSSLLRRVEVWYRFGYIEESELAQEGREAFLLARPVDFNGQPQQNYVRSQT